MDLSNASLMQVEMFYQQGRIDRAAIATYLREWNAGPHFTQALLRDGRIRNYDAESFPKYLATPENIAEFGIRL